MTDTMTISNQAAAVQPIKPEIQEQQHTPGPWRALERYTGRQAIPIGAPIATSGRACSYVFAEAHGHNCEANARLIASAPEMLKALQSVLASVPFLSYRGDGELEECEASVRAAIAKATGQGKEVQS